ncbi:hypothetical protein PAMP_001467 [Pampus punctatissimus]
MFVPSSPALGVVKPFLKDFCSLGTYFRKGDKGAAAEPFGCAQGGPAQHVGRLRPAWAPVWGPGPCTLLLCVRERPLPSCQGGLQYQGEDEKEEEIKRRVSCGLKRPDV